MLWQKNGGDGMTEEEPAGAQAQCQNCRASLLGPYCHHCGQPAKPVVRFFGTLVVEFLQETISLDSRAMRTLVALLTRPGFLTNAYLRGRRKRFVPPLRLFLFTSLVCIFAIWLLNVTSDRDLVVGPGGVLTLNGELSPEQREQLGTRMADERLEELDPAQRAEIEEQLDRLETILQSGARAAGRDTAQQPSAGNDPATAEAEPAGPEPRSSGVNFTDGELTVDVPWLSETNNRQLEARLRKSIAKISEDPDDFLSDLLENIPQTTLLLVPLLALLMKLVYPFTGRYYVEHLIHALHGHAFLFLTVLLLIGLDVGDRRLSVAASTPLQWLGELLGMVEALLLLWVPIYFLLSLRAVYGQSWGLTVWKGFWLWLCYCFLFFFALVSLLLVSVLVS
ncbi:DUF3667 domain-containing protein [Haliea sp. E1-2-M8]|uniref:DUF3667 domain-containing protein n=1 Tax=Haliea sp. E1-2-M8 TaxID=3064706 RepID=UPI0027249D1A|nr:DUF3667 domain-containing protein [Haliea sp. E1-2-M8]MDO8862295.1 DUF3667 domain-containing protein [Haliea sp. E1-2-M8]